MVTWDAEGVTRAHHVANEAQGVQNSWAPVYQVADENRSAALGVDVVVVRPTRTGIGKWRALVAQQDEQLFQLVAAAVNVANEVEGTPFGSLVVPEGRPFNDGRFNLLGGIEDEDVPKPLSLQSFERSTEL
jgi:hypothetical protein